MSSAVNQPTQVTSSRKHVFAPDRGHLLGGIIMALICLIFVGYAPTKLFWVFLFPALLIWWTVRSRTTVTPEAITVRYAFRPGQTIPFDQITGFRFGGLQTFARLHEKRKDIPLPGISFNSIPALSLATAGRIPNVIEDSHKAAAEKVVVITRDGRHILKEKEKNQGSASSDDLSTRRISHEKK